MIAYKLLNRDLTTYNQTQWVVGETKRTNGAGGLCGPGWLHAYAYAELAHFFNPIHANFTDPVLYEVEAGGHRLDDGQLKSGWTEMTLLYSSPCPTPTLEQRIRFAIRCSLAVYHDISYRAWAINWVTNRDRSYTATNATNATNAARAARAAARAATNVATYRAANAARAAAYAAANAAYAATNTAYAAYAAYAAATNVATYMATNTAYTAYAAYAAANGADRKVYTIDLHACAVWAYSDSLDLDEVL